MWTFFEFVTNKQKAEIFVLAKQCQLFKFISACKTAFTQKKSVNFFFPIFFENEGML